MTHRTEAGNKVVWAAVLEKTGRLLTVTVEGQAVEAPYACSGLDALRLAARKDKALDALLKNSGYHDNPIVAILANNELLPLSGRLRANCVLTPVRLYSEHGKRVYRHSICFLLSRAAHELFPGRRLVIGHSLGDGYYFSFDDEQSVPSMDIRKLSERMQVIVEAAESVENIHLSYQQSMDYFTAMGFTQTRSILEYRNEPLISLYRSGSYVDIAYEPLVYNTSIMALWELKPYGSRGMLLRYPRSIDFHTLLPWRDNPLLFSVFTEYKKRGIIQGVSSLGELNKVCGTGDIRSFIRLSETLQESKISAIADQIHRRGTVRAVFIAGPSSSGKTTFAQKLGIHLQVAGYSTVKVSLDNYYVPRDQVPLDEFGEKDYEALEALDTAGIRNDITALCRGESVVLPRFSFKDSKRFTDGPAITVDASTLLIIEGIHGLNPALRTGLEDNQVFRVYISALTQLNLDDHNRISTTDNRILRRLVRDKRTRHVDAKITLGMWSSVERGERRHIFPYQNNADAMLNSALDYELGVLAPFAEPLLRAVKPQDGKAYTIARRLLAFLKNAYPIQESLVPGDSLLREFIGGSEFHAE
ncbi:nucleoside kinase [Parasphaerochaeta coccoides]|uniref:AAA ATPase n=1 Tax=Parasphaerochaeta coccoides (strain ATCC BAA-1237 / DSM 17374 / SPN1) TaxID=760011 RepID=F4GLP5_PARC1|nr:nucleoside kinase [Parasphaerochaeta coccoides]AEC02439.1 AAA ATPase [Parasphaerochaeta coccoides DSM 17374]